MLKSSPRQGRRICRDQGVPFGRDQNGPGVIQPGALSPWEFRQAGPRVQADVVPIQRSTVGIRYRDEVLVVYVHDNAAVRAAVIPRCRRLSGQLRSGRHSAGPVVQEQATHDTRI